MTEFWIPPAMLILFSFILSIGETSFGFTIRFNAFSQKGDELDRKLTAVVYLISTEVRT